MEREQWIGVSEWLNRKKNQKGVQKHRTKTCETVGQRSAYSKPTAKCIASNINVESMRRNLSINSDIKCERNQLVEFFHPHHLKLGSVTMEHANSNKAPLGLSFEGIETRTGVLS
jgi:hypothetical protein